MSKTNLIALAIAAALASPAAFAVDVTPATPDVLPLEAMTGNTQVITNGDSIDIAAAADDLYLGRNTGYNITVTLQGGATFAAAVPVPASLNGETVTIAGGGYDGATSVTYSVEPAQGVVEGDGISINAGDYQVDHAGFMANGAPLQISVRVGDPVGGGTLASTASPISIASAVEGWVVTYSAPANPDIRIDVGSDSAKKMFSSDGTVNLADTANFNAGAVSIAINPDLTNVMGLSLATATAPLTLTGSDFTPFTNGGSVFLDSVNTCDSGAPLAATVNSNKTAASIAPATTAAAVNAKPFVCFTSNGDDTIQNQAIGGSVVVKQVSLKDSPTFADSGNKLLDMAYNGAVKRVWAFNPSTNADQQSYLRITNSSSTPGLFTIDGICDDGTAGSSVTFTMAAGRSMLLTSQDVENGNAAKGLTGAMGTCTANGTIGQTGKRRLTVTGEVGTMEVQNFLRNGTSAGAVNTNVNNVD